MTRKRSASFIVRHENPNADVYDSIPAYAIMGHTFKQSKLAFGADGQKGQHARAKRACPRRVTKKWQGNLLVRGNKRNWDNRTYWLIFCNASDSRIGDKWWTDRTKYTHFSTQMKGVSHNEDTARTKESISEHTRTTAAGSIKDSNANNKPHDDSFAATRVKGMHCEHHYHNALWASIVQNYLRFSHFSLFASEKFWCANPGFFPTSKIQTLKIAPKPRFMRDSGFREKPDSRIEISAYY